MFVPVEPRKVAVKAHHGGTEGAADFLGWLHADVYGGDGKVIPNAKGAMLAAVIKFQPSGVDHFASPQQMREIDEVEYQEFRDREEKVRLELEDLRSKPWGGNGPAVYTRAA